MELLAIDSVPAWLAGEGSSGAGPVHFPGHQSGQGNGEHQTACAKRYCEAKGFANEAFHVFFLQLRECKLTSQLQYSYSLNKCL